MNLQRQSYLLWHFMSPSRERWRLDRATDAKGGFCSQPLQPVSRLKLSIARETILHNPRPPKASAYFLERAKYYRFAAAMTENPQEIERLCDIAFMFERMAHEVRRLRDGQVRFPAG